MIVVQTQFERGFHTDLSLPYALRQTDFDLHQLDEFYNDCLQEQGYKQVLVELF